MTEAHDTANGGARQYLSPLFGWRGAVSSGGSGLRPTERHVALALSLHMNEKGGSCFPSIVTLSVETGWDERTVRRCLTALETAGWLCVLHGGGKGHPNRYTAVVPETRADIPGLTTHVTQRNLDSDATNKDSGAPKGDCGVGVGRHEDDKRSLAPSCEKCEDTGWMEFRDDTFGFAAPCSCRQ